MSTDGWRLKKRSRDPEAAEVAWQKWKHDRPDHSRGTRGMTKTTAEAHLFSVRMRTIRDNLEKEFTNSNRKGGSGPSLGGGGGGSLPAST